MTDAPQIKPGRGRIGLMATVFILVLGACTTSTTTSQAPAASQPAATEESSAQPSEAPQEAVTLRLSHDQPVDHPNTANMELFASEVEERTGGSVTVEIYPAAQLFNERDVLPALQRDEVDMALVLPSTWSTLVPAVLITDIPFIFTSWEEFHAALDGELGSLLTGAFEEHGARTLYWQDNSTVDLFGTRDRIVRVPADVDGMRLRSFSEALAQAMTLWGAAPTVIPGGEAYTAVERGTVDGLLSGVSFYERQWYEVAPFISQIPMLYAASPVQINVETWDSLSPEQQEAIQAAADAAEASNREETPTTVADAYAELETLAEEWYEVTDEELAQWVEATAGMEEWYLDQAGELGAEVLAAAESP